jgi:hypothetical protein
VTTDAPAAVAAGAVAAGDFGVAAAAWPAAIAAASTVTIITGATRVSHVPIVINLPGFSEISPPPMQTFSSQLANVKEGHYDGHFLK